LTIDEGILRTVIWNPVNTGSGTTYTDVNTGTISGWVEVDTGTNITVERGRLTVMSKFINIK
jgi:hypothetical protein